MNAATDTRTLSTDALEVGMIVQHYGARLRLTKQTFTAEEAAKRADVEPTLRAFATEFVGNVNDDRPHSIPASWLKDWTVQGNHFAMWRVEA